MEFEMTYSRWAGRSREEMETCITEGGAGDEKGVV